MRCPFCASEEDKVVDSRAAQDGRSVRRRRECLACGKRYTTYEYVEKVSLTVVKNDGKREDFDRQKLFKGIALACNKRPISEEQINNLVTQIEEELQNSSRETEVTSKKIGELVMDRLKSLDEVAYVRFASVYRKFKDKNEFLDELKGLLG
jgi:transcriptional repressor NrdR